MTITGLSAAEVTQINRNNVANLLTEIAIAIKTRYVGFETIHIEDQAEKYNPEAMGLFAHFTSINSQMKKCGHHVKVNLRWSGNDDLYIVNIDINGMRQFDCGMQLFDTESLLGYVFSFLDQVANKRNDMKIESGRKYNVWHKEVIAARLSPGDLMVTAALDSGPYFNRITAIELVVKADIENCMVVIETDRGGSYTMDQLSKVRIATFVASVA